LNIMPQLPQRITGCPPDVLCGTAMLWHLGQRI